MNIISKYLLPFSCLFLSSFSFSQTLNNTSTNQLYFKLNSLENLSDFSWKQIEDNSQDISNDENNDKEKKISLPKTLFH